MAQLDVLLDIDVETEWAKRVATYDRYDLWDERDDDYRCVEESDDE